MQGAQARSTPEVTLVVKVVEMLVGVVKIDDEALALQGTERPNLRARGRAIVLALEVADLGNGGSGDLFDVKDGLMARYGRLFFGSGDGVTNDRVADAAVGDDRVLALWALKNHLDILVRHVAAKVQRLRAGEKFGRLKV